MITSDIYKLKAIGKNTPKVNNVPLGYTASIHTVKRYVGLPSQAVKFMDLPVRFSYYQVLVDTQCSSVFWIRGLVRYEDGSRVFTSTQRRLNYFEIENLFDYLGVKDTGMFHCMATWDKDLAAIKIDLNNRVDGKKRVYREPKVRKHKM